MKLIHTLLNQPHRKRMTESRKANQARLVLDCLEHRLAPALGGVTPGLEPPTAGTNLTPTISFGIPGDYVAAGGGFRGATSGTIHISGIPAGSSIVGAYLYYTYLGNSEPGTLPTITFAGTNFTGTKIGSGPDTNWGDNFSFSYRANVTSKVTGNGPYALTNIA